MASTLPSDLNVGDTVRYVGPSNTTKLQVGKIRRRVVQVEADDLFFVDWKDEPEDTELYHACRLLRVGPGRRSAPELMRMEVEAFKDTALVLLADALPEERPTILSRLGDQFGPDFGSDLADSLSLMFSEDGEALLTPEERAAR